MLGIELLALLLHLELLVLLRWSGWLYGYAFTLFATD